MLTTELAAKQQLRLSLSGIIDLNIDDKKVDSKKYHNQQQRKNIIAAWHEQFQLFSYDHSITIKPKT